MGKPGKQPERTWKCPECGEMFQPQGRSMHRAWHAKKDDEREPDAEPKPRKKTKRKASKKTKTEPAPAPASDDWNRWF